MSLGLRVYGVLRQAACDLDALRAGCAPGAPAWVALTEMVLTLEGLLQALVASAPLEEDDTPPPPEKEPRMPSGRPTTLTVRLTHAERHTLTRWQRSTTMRAAQARRGRLLLLLDGGLSISQVAREVGLSRRHVYKWVRRYLTQGVAGLTDLPRPGRWGRREDVKP
jgi:hypothetical protein